MLRSFINNDSRILTLAKQGAQSIVPCMLDLTN